jgi:hypothetical protein
MPWAGDLLIGEAGPSAARFGLTATQLRAQHKCMWWWR